ncbi:MAG: hypothetical protein FJZ93_06920 [Chloroflexi bacterium]|nr:hypothetical protein [Chloroflexota bacterium]
MADEQTKTENQSPPTEDKAAIEAELLAEAIRNDKLVEEATAPLREKIAEFERQLTTREAELKELNERYQLKEQELAGASAAYLFAVEDYRQLAAQANPFVTLDLLEGGTIDAIKGSMARANALVSKVKESMQQQAQAFAQLANVPAGAPGRTEPDLAALSPAEKIAYGLEQAKRKK